MLQGEITEMNYHLQPENYLLQIPSSNNYNLSMIQPAAFQFNSSVLSNFPHTIPPPAGPQSSSCLSSNNSTSDEADEHQRSIIDERKQRRMISNRESARRSRMRKQKHLDELWSQVVRLRNENHGLIDKLNHVSECHHRVVQENAKLKEEAADLRRMLSDLQIASPYTAVLRAGIDDQITCNTAHLRAESTHNSTISTTSVDLLH